MRRYYCDFFQRGVELRDTVGFEATDDPAALRMVKAIAAIVLDDDPHLGDTVIRLRASSGTIISEQSAEFLLRKLQ